MKINQAQFAQIVETAKAKAANCPRWLRAIDRAAEAMKSGELCVTLLADGALVTSANGSYRVTNTCDKKCKASANGHGQCYHRAAVRLTEMMEAAPAPVAAEKLARAKARSAANLAHDRVNMQRTAEAARITRTIEQDRTGQRYTVVYCRDNNGVEWAI